MTTTLLDLIVYVVTLCLFLGSFSRVYWPNLEENHARDSGISLKDVFPVHICTNHYETQLQIMRSEPLLVGFRKNWSK